MEKTKSALTSFIVILLISFTSVLSEVQTSIAILSLRGNGISASEARILTDELRTVLVQTGKYNVLERNNMESILEEQGFQMSGCTSADCAVEAGKLLGVNKMLAGSIGKLGTLYNISIRTFNVETGKIDKTVSRRHSGSIEQLLDVMEHVGYELTNSTADKTIKEEIQTGNTQTAENTSNGKGLLFNQNALAIKAGITSTTTTQHSKNEIGFSAGCAYSFPFLGIYLRPELLYTTRKFEYYSDEFIKYEIFQLNTLLSFNIKPITNGNFILSLNAGPGINYLFSAFKEAYGDSYDLYKYDDGSSEVENTEMVLIFSPGAGFDFGKFAVLLEARYELGLTEIFKNEESWEAGKSRVLTFMAGISF